MARSMADDYQDTYRARIEYQFRTHNPNFVYGRPQSADNPRLLDPAPDAPVYVKCFGPYATKGVAKGMVTQESRGPALKVISATVQKASITWEDVDD